MIQINKDQIKDLANLYDIKTLSQAVAEKGWAFLCKNTRQDLEKAYVPTLYQDIKDKYDNCDKGASDVQDKSNIKAITYADGYYYFQEYYDPDNWAIKKSANIDLSEAETIDITFPDNEYYNTLDKIFVLENYFVFIMSNISTITYIFDKNFNYITKLSRDFSICRKVNDNVCFAWHDFGIWKFNGTTGQFETVVEQVLEDENYRYFPFRANETFTFFFCGWDNRMSSNGNGAYASFVNGQLHFGWTDSDNRYKSDIITVGNDNIYAVPDGSEWGKSEFLRFYKIQYNSENSQYVSIPYSTMTVTDHSYPTIPHQIIKDGDTYYIITQYSLLTTSDFSSYSAITYTPEGDYDNFYGFVDSNSFFVLDKGQDAKYIYSGLVKTVYTDTYSIDGNVVTINYYRNNDFKICISDNGGTNDTNLATIYSYMDYYNYYRLDTANKTVSLPRNSNLYTMMYVGDDYEDTNIGFEGEYSAFALKTDLDILPSQEGNNGKFLTTNGSSLSWAEVQGGGGSSYYKAVNVSILSSDWISDTVSVPGYNYKCEIPCVGVTAQSIPEVYFSDADLQSGNYSSVCESGINIITIYSKVNDAITIPAILAF